MFRDPSRQFNSKGYDLLRPASDVLPVGIVVSAKAFVNCRTPAVTSHSIYHSTITGFIYGPWTQTHQVPAESILNRDSCNFKIWGNDGGIGIGYKFPVNGDVPENHDFSRIVFCVSTTIYQIM